MIIDFLLKNTPLLYLVQPLWRDEAFSVLISEHSFREIIGLTSIDFNPPFYYFLLHFWMRIFGEGEIALRLLSFLFHLLLVFVIYRFAKALKFSKLTTYYLLLTTFLNPMLIYFSFEVRMYSLLALLATASMYCFYTKKWFPYILISALGLWTQPFFIFILLAQGVYLLVTKNLKKEHLFSFAAIFLLFLPWLPTVLFQLSRSGPMWIWPINLTTVTTILGNLLTGYEGTPGGLWNKMAVLSSLIIVFSAFLLRNLLILKKNRLSSFYRLLLLWLFLPTVLVLTISSFKPIYVNRYLIFVTVAEVFLIAVALPLIKNKLIRNLFAICNLLFAIGFNVWFPSLHKKQDIRTTIFEITQLAKKDDVILPQTPLTFFETSYYFTDRSRVFLFNPKLIAVPSYAGASLITEEKMTNTLPKYPKRAFLIHDDASYEIIFQK